MLKLLDEIMVAQLLPRAVLNGAREKRAHRETRVCLHVCVCLCIEVCEALNLGALILDSYRNSSGTRPQCCFA